MAYSKKEWEVVKAFYEEGLSLAEIIARDEVAIKDRSSISRRANKESWIKGQNSTLTALEIQTKQMHAEVVEKKSTLNATALEIHNTIVDERTKNLQFFNNAQLSLANIAMKKIEKAVDAQGNVIGDLSMIEIKGASDVIKTSREGVLGKAPDVAVQINNNNNGNEQRVRTLAEFYGSTDTA